MRDSNRIEIRLKKLGIPEVERRLRAGIFSEEDQNHVREWLKDQKRKNGEKKSNRVIIANCIGAIATVIVAILALITFFCNKGVPGN